MKIFITGGTGFIGRHLVRRMAQTRHTMRCLASETSDTAELKDLGADIIVGDVNDRASLHAGMKGCDWVFNLANVYSFWEADKTIYRKVNVEGTRNVMECALEASVSKIVHVSTVAVYGRPNESPLREETPVAPIRKSIYAQTKYEGDQIAWQLYREKGLPLVGIYPCLVVGSGDPKLTGQTVRLFISKRMPARIFDNKVFLFVHVGDVVEAILKAAEKADNLGKKYIVGNTNLSMGDMYNLISDVSGVAPPALHMPDFLVMFNARILTWLANMIKRPPLWGMSTDAVQMMKEGDLVIDGSKAEYELGIIYTPIRKAVEEEVAYYRQTAPEFATWKATGKVTEFQRYWRGKERRNEPRNKVELSCVVDGLFHGEQACEMGQVIELTEHGMYVEANAPLDEGTETKAQIKGTRFSEAFWVMGKVLRRTAKGMAIRFADPVPKEIEMILTTR